MARLETLATLSGTLVVSLCPDCGHRLVLLRPRPRSWVPGPPTSVDRRACSGCSAMWQITVREVPAPTGCTPVIYADFLPLDPSTLLPR
jgi:hypothetical protein